MTTHIEQAVAARIVTAKRKAEQKKGRRAELNEAREHRLEARHTAKMRRWALEDVCGDIPTDHEGDDE